MKFAEPVNAKGQRNGDVKQFSDREWHRLMLQKVIRWVEIPDPLRAKRKIKPVTPKKVVKKK